MVGRGGRNKIITQPNHTAQQADDRQGKGSQILLP